MNYILLCCFTHFKQNCASAQPLHTHTHTYTLQMLMSKTYTNVHTNQHAEKNPSVKRRPPHTHINRFRSQNNREYLFLLFQYVIFFGYSFDSLTLINSLTTDQIGSNWWCSIINEGKLKTLKHNDIPALVKIKHVFLTILSSHVV